MPSTDIATVDISNPISFPTLKQGFVLANDFQFQRTVRGLIPPDSPLLGWLTIKAAPALGDQSGPQAAIGINPSGSGQIIPSTGLLVFNVKAVQTAMLNSGPEYYYDVKVQVTPSGNIYTIEEGYIQFLPAITDAPIDLVFPSQQLPPLEPLLMTGATNPNGVVSAPVGTRFWIVPPVPGYPCEYVNIDGGATWRADNVVSLSPPPIGQVPAIIIANIPVIYYGPTPPPNGLLAPTGARYWVSPPIPGLPSEYVAIDNMGTWRATNAVSLTAPA